MFKPLAFALMLLTAATAPARAQDAPSAMASGQDAHVIAVTRSAAEYALTLQTQKWVPGPAFTTGEQKWYLQGTVTDIPLRNFASGDAGPFQTGDTVLFIPYCTPGTLATPDGPGSACADFVNRRVQIWSLMADTHARRMKDGRLLYQVENLLDAAFLP